MTTRSTSTVQLTWVDWASAPEWTDLTAFVRRLGELRRCHPPGEFRFYGVGGDIDEGFESHSLAWCSGPLYDAWRDPLDFELQEPGEWRVVLATASATATAVVEVGAHAVTSRGEYVPFHSRKTTPPHDRP